MPDLPLIPTFWTVDIPGAEATSVNSISGLDQQTPGTQIVTNDAQGNPVVIKVPGPQVSGGTLTLSRMIDTTNALGEWYTNTHAPGQDPSSQKQDITVTMQDQAGQAIKTYNVKGCLIESLSGATLNSGANEVATETATISYEGIELM
jgi:phage tail-like protein